MGSMGDDTSSSRTLGIYPDHSGTAKENGATKNILD